MANQGGESFTRIKGISSIFLSYLTNLIQGRTNQPILIGHILKFFGQKESVKSYDAPFCPVTGHRFFLFFWNQFKGTVNIIDQPAKPGRPFRFPDSTCYLDQVLQTLLPGSMRGNNMRQISTVQLLSLIHISEPTRRTPISYA